MINQLGDAPPPATTKPITSTPATSLTKAWHDAVAHAQANSPQQSAMAPFSNAKTQSTNGWVEHPGTITEVIRDQQLQAQQDCTAPGHFGPLGYKPFQTDPNAPRAEALPPGALQAETNQATAKQAFLNWLSGGDLPPDPHVPEGSDPLTEVETRTFGGSVPVQYPVDDGGPEVGGP